ncbi:transmembrane protein 184C-like [Asterias amurensis]|uniref:transmembrane protein 184C-like n=1 Tax=Asterias amurensis TaxID=7602 RepID=UPI003AB74246
MDPTREANRVERGDTSTAPPGNSTDPRSCLGSWRRWIRPLVYVIYGLFVALGVPLIIIDVSRAEEENFKRTLGAVGFFAMVVAIPISIWGIINHIVYYTRPSLQKHIIRILFMVPIYEMNSWFALRFPDVEIYLDTLRQLYQAFVMYNFVYYLLTFFDEVPNFENRLVMKPQIKSPPPCCCVRAVPNQRIIRRCKAGVLNYTVIRIVVTIVSIITHLTGNYNEGNFSAKYAYLWVTVIVSISQIWAIFCINLLRKATLDELKMLPRSTSQFVGIQLVIFVTNFQSTLLNILAQTGVMKPKPAWGFEDEFAFATMLQDFLICLEMVACAILFSYSFDYQRYNMENEQKMSIAQSVKHMMTMTDVKTNIMERLRGKGHSSASQQNTDLVRMEQPPAVDGVPPSLASQSPTEAVGSPRRTQGHPFTSLPDIILNHQENSDINRNQENGMESQSDSHLQVKKSSEGTSDNDTDDFMDGDFTTDDSDINDNPRRPSVEDQLETAQVKSLQVLKRQKKISCTGLKMSFDDDDDVSTNGEDVTNKSDGDQIDTPDTRHLAIPGSRPHQSSDADMALDVNDISSDDDDSDNDIRYRSISAESRTASLPVPQRRTKKVSYAGMTFDDMDWYVMSNDEDLPPKRERKNTGEKKE